MGNLNRRKHPRANTQLLIGETVGGRYFRPMLTNISEEGIYLESPSGLDRPRDHDPILEISLPDSSQLIWVRCRHLRKENHGFFQGQALGFFNISAFDRQKIRSFIQRTRDIA